MASAYVLGFANEGVHLSTGSGCEDGPEGGPIVPQKKDLVEVTDSTGVGRFEGPNASRMRSWRR